MNGCYFFLEISLVSSENIQYKINDDDIGSFDIQGHDMYGTLKEWFEWENT